MIIKRSEFRDTLKIKKVAYLIVSNFIPIIYLYNRSISFLEWILYLILFNTVVAISIFFRGVSWFVIDQSYLEVYNPLRKKRKIPLEQIRGVEVESYVRTGNVLIIHLKDGKSCHYTTNVNCDKLNELKQLIYDYRYELFRNSGSM